MTTNRVIDAVRVRDQLGDPDAKAIFGPFKKVENFVITDSPTMVIEYNTSAMAVWDDPNSTWDGTDLDDKWLDYENENVKTISRIVNTNNIFQWDFQFEDTFGDDNKQITAGFLGSATTATVNTSTQTVNFDIGDVLEIQSAYLDESASTTVISATLNLTTASGTFNLEMSSDGGSNYESVTDGVNKVFTDVGSDLRIKITYEAIQFVTSDSFDLLTSDGLNFIVASGYSDTINLIKCEYTIGE